MSVPERIAQRKALYVYTNFRRLIKKMGEQGFVNALDTEEINEILRKLNVRNAIHDEYRESPTDLTETWSNEGITFWGGDPYAGLDVMEGFHPVFLLAEHFMGHDGDSFESGGYIKLHNRGDALVIPGYLEDGEPWFMVISFHKGGTTTNYMYFPTAKREDKLELAELIATYETR